MAAPVYISNEPGSTEVVIISNAPKQVALVGPRFPGAVPVRVIGPSNRGVIPVTIVGIKELTSNESLTS